MSCVVVVCGTQMLFAAAGQAGASFLKMSPDARSVAMGETGIAAAGEGSPYWNPAALGLLSGRSLSFGHTRNPEQTNFDSVSGNFPALGDMFGFSLSYLSMGSIAAYDVNDVASGESFTAADGAFSAGYGRTAGPWSFGAALKYITSTIEKHSASAVAFDVGTVGRVSPRLLIGASVRNMGTALKYVSEDTALPADIGIGSSYEVPVNGKDRVTVALDARKEFAGDATVHSGAEYRHAVTPEMALAGRLGYRTGLADTGAAGGVAGGIGILWRSYGFDYAFTSYGDLGNAQRLSLRISF